MYMHMYADIHNEYVYVTIQNGGKEGEIYIHIHIDI